MNAKAFLATEAITGNTGEALLVGAMVGQKQHRHEYQQGYQDGYEAARREFERRVMVPVVVQERPHQRDRGFNVGAALAVDAVTGRPMEGLAAGMMMGRRRHHGF